MRKTLSLLPVAESSPCIENGAEKERQPYAPKNDCSEPDGIVFSGIAICLWRRRQRNDHFPDRRNVDREVRGGQPLRWFSPIVRERRMTEGSLASRSRRCRMRCLSPDSRSTLTERPMTRVGL